MKKKGSLIVGQLLSVSSILGHQSWLHSDTPESLNDWLESESMAFFNSCLAKLSKVDMNGNIRKKRRKKLASLFFLPCIFALAALPVLYLSTLLKFATYCFLWWLHFLNLQTYPPWLGRHTVLFLSLLNINGPNSPIFDRLYKRKRQYDKFSRFCQCEFGPGIKIWTTRESTVF